MLILGQRGLPSRSLLLHGRWSCTWPGSSPACILPWSSRGFSLVGLCITCCFALLCLLMHHFPHVCGPADDLRRSAVRVRFSPLACGSSRSPPGSPGDGDDDAWGPWHWAAPPPAPGDDACACHGAAWHRPPTLAHEAAGVVRDARQPSRRSWPQRGAARLRRRYRRRRVSCLRGDLARPGWRARAAAGRAAAPRPGRPRCRNRQALQGAGGDHPGRCRPPLAGRQRAGREPPPEAGGTDSPLRRGWLERQPRGLLRDMGPARLRPPTRATVRPPRCPGPGARAQALPRGRPGLGAPDRGACAAHRQRRLRGRTARRPRGLPRPPHLRVPPAVPGALQQGRRGRVERSTAPRLQSRPPPPFLQRCCGRRRVPPGRPRLAPRAPPGALRVAARAPTARPRGAVGCPLCALAPGVVPTPCPCSRSQPVVRSDLLLGPSGPPDRVRRLLPGACDGLPWRGMGRLATLERRARRLDARGRAGLQPGRRPGLIDPPAPDRHAGRGAPGAPASPTAIPWPAPRGATRDALERAAAAPTPQPAPAPRRPPCGGAPGRCCWPGTRGLHALGGRENQVPAAGARRRRSQPAAPRLQGLVPPWTLPGPASCAHRRGLGTPRDAGASRARRGQQLGQTRPTGPGPEEGVARRPRVDRGPRPRRRAVPPPGLPGPPTCAQRLEPPVPCLVPLTVGPLGKALGRGPPTAHRPLPHARAAAAVWFAGLPRPLPHHAQRLCGQRALHAEADAVGALAWLLAPLLLPPHGLRMGTALAPMRPVPVVPRPACRGQRPDTPDPPLTHGGPERSTARARVPPCATAASVRSEEDDRPTAHGAGTVRSGLWAPLTLLVVTDVRVAGLADSDGSGAGPRRRTPLRTPGSAPGAVRRAPWRGAAGHGGRGTAGVGARGAAARRWEGPRAAHPAAVGGCEGSWASHPPCRWEAQDVAGAVVGSQRKGARTSRSARRASTRTPGVGASGSGRQARGASLHAAMALWTPSGSVTTRRCEVWRRHHRTSSPLCPQQGWCESQIWAIDA